MEIEAGTRVAGKVLGEGVNGGVFFDDDEELSGGEAPGDEARENTISEELAEVCRESPVGFAREYLGVRLWSKQEEALRAVRDHRRVAVKAGNGLGKGFTAAVAVLWFIYCHNPAIVLTTAPTGRQVRHVLWREIRRLHGKAGRSLGGHVFNSRWEVAHDRFALGLSTDEADQFQGFHSPNMLIVVDEAEGVEEPIYDAIEAVMTTGNCKLLLIGNPTSDSGTFRRAFHEDRRMYHTITISALESPNVEQQRVVVPGLTTAEWVAERAGMWGEESPMYQARVLGLFCDQPQDRLIPLSKIEQAIARHRLLADSRESGRRGPSTSGAGCTSNLEELDVQPAPFAEDERKEVGADYLLAQEERKEDRAEHLLAQEERKEDGEEHLLAQEERKEAGADYLLGDNVGGDHAGSGGEAHGATVLAVDVARFGQDQSVLLTANPDRVLEIKAYRGLDTMELTGRVVEAHCRWKPQRIVVDEIGIGAGVVDRLKELGLPVSGINVGRPARQRKVFANLRAEGYWNLYELFNQGAIAIPDDAELAGQLSSLKPGQNSRGQLFIEKKDDARARGLPSPDKADALMLAFLRGTGGVRLWV